MHKVVHKSAPDYLVDVLPNVANAEKHYNLRNNDDLDQFTFKTEKFRKSLFPDRVRKWNRLDKDIRAVVSHNSFKNKIVTDKCSPSSLFYLGQHESSISYMHSLVWTAAILVLISIAFMLSTVQPVYALIQLRIQHTTSWIVLFITHKEWL